MSQETVHTCGHIAGVSRWSAWLDGEIQQAERQAIEQHLSACHVCREQARAWLALRSCLASAAPPDPDQASAAFWQR
ncbi:MAG: anti-sigma factor family protein, partial [Anaerolineae bacterium]